MSAGRPCKTCPKKSVATADKARCEQCAPDEYYGPSFAYSPLVHSFHARRDRVVSLPPRRLYGAAIRKSPTARVGSNLDFALRLK